MDNEQGKNDKARKILNDVFDSWEQVGYDESTDTVYRKPLTKEAIEISQQEINKAKALNPDDEWVVNRIKELQDVLDYQNKREYTGSKFIPIFLILFGGLGLLANLFMGSDPTVDTAIKWREKHIIKLEKKNTETEATIYQIENKRKKYAGWSDEDRTEEIKDKQEYLQERKTDITELKALNNDALFELYLDQYSKNRPLRVMIGALYLLAGLFYKKAFSSRRYVSEKVTPKIGKIEKAGDVVGNIFERLVVGLMSVPDLKVTTKYSDGSTETKTHNPLFWLGAFLMFFVPFLLLAYYLTLAPLAVSIAYYFNYVRNN